MACLCCRMSELQLEDSKGGGRSDLEDHSFTHQVFTHQLVDASSWLRCQLGVWAEHQLVASLCDVSFLTMKSLVSEGQCPKWSWIEGVCVCVCRHTHITSNCLWPYGLQSARLPSVHRIFQAKMLECVAISSFRDLQGPGMEPKSPALQADFIF